MKSFTPEDYELLKEIQTIDYRLCDSFDFENKFKKNITTYEEEVRVINDHITTLTKELEEINAQIAEEETKISECKKKKNECEKEKEKVANGDNIVRLDDEIEIQELYITLSQGKIDKYKKTKNSKEVQLEWEKKNIVNVENSFEEFKKMIFENNSSSEEEIENLKNKRDNLIEKLSFEAASVYKNLTQRENVYSPIAVLKNGICTNCNLLNITNIQLDIISKRRIVQCEYCGSILIDVISNKEECCCNDKSCSKCNGNSSSVVTDVDEIKEEKIKVAEEE